MMMMSDDDAAGVKMMAGMTDLEITMELLPSLKI